MASEEANLWGTKNGEEMNKLAYTFIVVALLGFCGCPAASDPALEGDWGIEDLHRTMTYMFRGTLIYIETEMERPVSDTASFFMSSAAMGTYTATMDVCPHEITIIMTEVDVTIDASGLSAEEESAVWASSGVSSWAEYEEESAEWIRTATVTMSYVVAGNMLIIDGSTVLTRQ
jgi:hypothetical protein